MSVLGIDIGSSGCKASVVDAEGAIAGQARAGYSLSSPSPGLWEIDPELVWSKAKEAIAAAVAEARAGGADPVRAIGASSFGEAIVALDSGGRVLRDAIMYLDPRGAEESRALEEELGPERLLEITGAPAHPMYSIAKLMWLRRHESGVFAAAREFRLMADFVLRRLGARPHTDYSLAARTQAFDVRRKAWCPEILEFAGLDEAALGECVQAGTVVGELGSHLARELGLGPGVLLVAGGHDQCCAALGAGVVRPGMAVDGLGSTECVTPAFGAPPAGPAMASAGFACVPHVVPGLYVTYAFTFACGSLLSWFRGVFAAGREPEARARGLDVLDLLVEEAVSAPTDLLLLPHFSGAATPYMDPLARGAIVGLALDTTGRDLARAVLEGITFEIMVNLERLESALIAIADLRVVGGLSRSDAYLRLKADMMGRTLSAPDVAEAGTLGVAMLALCACGRFRDAEAAAAALVRTRRAFEPDPGRSAAYRAAFERYKRLYPALKSALGDRGA